MTYSNKERRRDKVEGIRKRQLMQARIYDKCDSFEEYAIKCATCGIKRRFALFGLVDPFWFHYKVNSVGVIALALYFAVPLMIAINAAVAVECKNIGYSPYVNVICGGITGLVVWLAVLNSICAAWRLAEKLLVGMQCENGALPSKGLDR